jgi:cation diffusion facilitator CzcD-associated flavoprotein CzcO
MNTPFSEDKNKVTDAIYHDVIVVGSGISGICAAIKLQEAKQDYVLLEKATEVGGVWRENTYPDCACDVPSSLYSFSFAPNPNWQRVFAKQTEIKSYCQDTADKFGIMPNIRFKHELLESRWNTTEKLWYLETSKGYFKSRFVIMACGPMHKPIYPNVDGLASFSGKSFHSATWDNDYDLTGKRVAVIGSGGSAIQFLPAIQSQVKELSLFQRTPPWVLPKADVQISSRWKSRFRRFPFILNLFRKVLYLQFEFLNHNLRYKSFSNKLEATAIKNINRGVKDPELRKKLLPDYALGCKRILLSNDWYRAIGKDNVNVLPGITKIEGNKLTASDGSSCEVDVIIFGTGFDVSNPPIGKIIYGESGRRLADLWAGSPEAYLGTMTEGCPNLFITLGPNLYTYTSAFVIVEAQIKYICSAITKASKKKIASIQVDPEASAALNKKIQYSLQDTVWNSGCSSYFIDNNGRNSINWPWTAFRMRRKLNNFRLSEYLIEKAS